MPIGQKSVTVQKFLPIKSRRKNGYFRLKILETDIKLQSINHNGILYEVIKTYSRGRYIVKMAS